MKRVAVTLLLLTYLASCGGAPKAVVTPARASNLPASAERAYGAVSSRLDGKAAIDTVAFMQQFWRLAGNPGYNASIDHLRDRLVRSGFSMKAADGTTPFVRVDEFPNPNPGWDYTTGTLTIEGESRAVLSRDRDRVSLAINSFSTPAGGVTARLVDVGRGSVQEFAGKPIEGAVVLGDAPLGVLWREAVRGRRAAGVISTEVADYIRPSSAAELSEEQRDVLQWGSVPYDEKARAFGFKASVRAAERLRAALKRDPGTRVQVEIASAFYTGANRSLVAEIPGRTRPLERIVAVAHVQEPGANDNASGCATLLVLARGLLSAIREGALPRPERTLTFMWVDEIRGSRQWISSHPAEAKAVQYMFSLDMTGEDTQKTGGTFLIEKQADPSAVWVRPSDPHTEWGGGQVKPESLKGSLLNDLHLAVADRRARDTGWVVKTNPYEGGSDHTVFAAAGVPSLLNWHFTDRYYHTNQDTADKVSAREMENVAITVATSAYVLAAADQRDADVVVDLLSRAAQARLALERRQGVELLAAAQDRVAAEKVEADVVAAWIKWYTEALHSVRQLSAAGAGVDLERRITSAQSQLR